MSTLLLNKIAIITGASQGLGFSIAERFLKSGARVVISGRNKDRLDAAVKALSAQGNDNVMGVAGDISCNENCQTLVDACLEKFGSVDILVNNAGIHGSKGAFDIVNWDDWITAIDVNLKGTVFMSRLVVLHMKKQMHGKIINLSGGGATQPMPFLSAYSASKAAVVRFTETVAEELKPFKIDINALAPGALNTALLDDLLTAGPELIGEKRYDQSLQQKEKGGEDICHATELCEYLASSKSDGLTGKLISAIWDPWKNLSRYHESLMSSDIYTLRRITSQDRGLDWI